MNTFQTGDHVTCDYRTGAGYERGVVVDYDDPQTWREYDSGLYEARHSAHAKRDTQALVPVRWLNGKIYFEAKAALTLSPITYQEAIDHALEAGIPRKNITLTAVGVKASYTADGQADALRANGWDTQSKMFACVCCDDDWEVFQANHPEWVEASNPTDSTMDLSYLDPILWTALDGEW